MKINIRQKLLFFSLIILVVIGLIGYAAYKSNQKLVDSEQWVQHSRQVIEQSGNILSLAKDIETASRGFVITGDSEFLKPLNSAEKTIFVAIRQLRQFTRDNPVQQQRVDSLDFYVRKRVDFSFHSDELRYIQGLTSAVDYISSKQGKQYTDHIRRITETIQQQENILLKQRTEIYERNLAAFNRLSVGTFILRVIFTILFIVVCGYYLLQNKEKRKRAAELVVADKELFFQTEEKGKRAAELIVANKELLFQNEEKGKRAAELIVANKELLFQNKEKEKRAEELTMANHELKIAELERKKITVDLIQRNSELEQFTYIVSHNLRAPVANIIGFSEAIFDEVLGEDERKEVGAALYDSAHRLDEVVHDLNNILKVKRESGKLKEPVNLSSIVDSIRLNSKHPIEKANATIITDFTAIDELFSLKSYIYSIFYNLISNSIKFFREGVDPVIEIKSAITIDKIIITFTDNGMGIDLSKRHDQVFGLYKRFHKHIDGKGVGLFMVKTEVESLGGTITISSEVDKGTEFTIEFDL